MELTDAEWNYIRLQAERIKRTVSTNSLPNDLKVANILHLTRSLCEAIAEADEKIIGDRRKH